MKEISVDNDFNYRLYYLGGFVERIQVTITFRYFFLYWLEFLSVEKLHLFYMSIFWAGGKINWGRGRVQHIHF